MPRYCILKMIYNTNKFINIFRKQELEGKRVLRIESFSLTDKTKYLVNTLIPYDNDRKELEAGLYKYCKYALSYNEECWERNLFAIIKISVDSGCFQKDDFIRAMNLAMIDFRDLLVDAGFADDVGMHNQWYKEVTKNGS